MGPFPMFFSLLFFLSSFFWGMEIFLAAAKQWKTLIKLDYFQWNRTRSIWIRNIFLTLVKILRDRGEGGKSRERLGVGRTSDVLFSGKVQYLCKSKIRNVCYIQKLPVSRVGNLSEIYNKTTIKLFAKVKCLNLMLLEISLKYFSEAVCKSEITSVLWWRFYSEIEYDKSVGESTSQRISIDPSNGFLRLEHLVSTRRTW